MVAQTQNRTSFLSQSGSAFAKEAIKLRKVSLLQACHSKLLCFAQVCVLRLAIVSLLLVSNWAQAEEGSVWSRFFCEKENRHHLQLLQHMQLQARDVVLYSESSMNGEVDAAKRIREARQELLESMRLLQQGGQFQGKRIVPVPAKKLQTAMNPLLHAADNLVQMQPTIAEVVQAGKKIRELMPDLASTEEELTTLLLTDGIAIRQVAMSFQLRILHERLAKNLLGMLDFRKINPEQAFQFGKDASTYADLLDGLIQGSEVFRNKPVQDRKALDKLRKMQAMFVQYRSLNAKILEHLQKLMYVGKLQVMLSNHHLDVMYQLRELEKN